MIFLSCTHIYCTPSVYGWTFLAPITENPLVDPLPSHLLQDNFPENIINTPPYLYHLALLAWEFFPLAYNLLGFLPSLETTLPWSHIPLLATDPCFLLLFISVLLESHLYPVSTYFFHTILFWIHSNQVFDPNMPLRALTKVTMPSEMLTQQSGLSYLIHVPLTSWASHFSSLSYWIPFLDFCISKCPRTSFQASQCMNDQPGMVGRNGA